MSLRLYDTLTREKQVFSPQNPQRVTMYVCGPTVYSRAHIGNARPAVIFDVLSRLLRHVYGMDAVTYARNVTDVDDKIIDEASAEGVHPSVIARRFEELYLADMGALGVRPPDIAPKATAHVPGVIAMISKLLEGGFAYAAEGHVLVRCAPEVEPVGRRVVDHAQVVHGVARRRLEEVGGEADEQGATVGFNQRGESVLEYVRWVMVNKRDAAAPSPDAVIPELMASVPHREIPQVPPVISSTGSCSMSRRRCSAVSSICSAWLRSCASAGSARTAVSVSAISCKATRFFSARPVSAASADGNSAFASRASPSSWHCPWMSMPAHGT